MPIDENSRRTRVVPFFRWLRDNGPADWPARLASLAPTPAGAHDPGRVLAVDLETERRVPPSPTRLAWMIRNAERLAPRDGREWREYQHRVMDNPGRAEALEKLDAGDGGGIEKKLVLEGKTSADCLIECERAVIWVEGKRNDWLDYSIKWDVTRDQLARNADAAWRYAAERGKEWRLIVCHEHALKHHEEMLIEGYRGGTWSGGLPHLEPHEREAIGRRIGTATWQSLAREWPELAPLLADGGA